MPNPQGDVKQVRLADEVKASRPCVIDHHNPLIEDQRLAESVGGNFARGRPLIFKKKALT